MNHGEARIGPAEPVEQFPHAAQPQLVGVVGHRAGPLVVDAVAEERDGGLPPLRVALDENRGEIPHFHYSSGAW